MKKGILYFAIVLAALGDFSTRAQSIVFENAYISSGTDVGQSILESPDSTLVVISYTTTNTSGLADFVITKMTADGTQQVWSVTHGGFNNDIPSAGVMLADGSIAVVGFTGSFTTTQSREVYLVKLDAAGNILWSKSYGGTGTDEGTDILSTPDGGFIITAGTESYGAGDRDAWLLKTDSLGNLLWSQTFGGSEYDDAWGVDLTVDGGYILTGGTYSMASGMEDDLWLIKADSLGNQEWIKTFGRANRIDWGWDVAAVHDGYVAVGLGNSDPSIPSFASGEAFFIKTDLQGNLLWDKSVSGTFRAMATSISPGRNGSWVIGGLRWTSGFTGDFWIAKADAQGNLLWEANLGQDQYLNVAWDAIQTLNGDVVATGYSGYSPNSSQDLHVVRLTDPTISAAETRPLQRQWMTAGPNPFEGEVRVTFYREGLQGTLEVRNAAGKTVLSRPINGHKSLTLDLSGYAEGLYFLYGQTAEERGVVKILKR